MEKQHDKQPWRYSGQTAIGRMPGPYGRENSLFISEHGLEGQGLLRDSSRNQGAGRCYLPLLHPSITHTHLEKQHTDTHYLTCLHQTLPPLAWPASVPALLVPSPRRPSTNLANNVTQAFCKACPLVPLMAVGLVGAQGTLLKKKNF